MVSQSDIAHSLILWHRPAIAAGGPPAAAGRRRAGRGRAGPRGRRHAPCAAFLPTAPSRRPPGNPDRRRPGGWQA